MFFYRAWASLRDLGRPEDQFSDQLHQQFLYIRWLYAILLFVTLAAGAVLNASVLLSFAYSPHLRALPHWAILLLALRDFLASVVLVPVAIYWFVGHMGVWGAGDLFCKLAALFDFALGAEYACLLIAFAIVLLTRDYVPPEDALEQHLSGLPQDEVDRRIGGLSLPSIVVQPPSSTSSPRPNPVSAPNPGSRPNSRPPSIMGSTGGRRGASRLPSRMEESASMAINSDLWEQASLDYPGRESPNRSFLEETINNDGTKEVRFNHWQRYLLILSWIPALISGFIAASMIGVQSTQRRPGCFIPVDPFRNPYAYTINDSGYNFHLIYVMLTYIGTAILLLLVMLAICYWRMADSVFRSMVRLLIWLIVVYVISRSPSDIQQLRALLEAGQGFNLRDAYEIEYEIVLVWTAFLPVIANPLLYITLIEEYREAFVKVYRKIFGCTNDDDENFDGNQKKEEGELETALRTEESDIL